jgi:sporulation protein YlmC with PRC-barrel domain
MSSTRRFISGLLVVSVIGLLFGYAWAAQQSTPSTPDNTSAQGSQATSPSGSSTMGQTMSQSRTGSAAQPMSLQRTSELIGKELKNAQGENLGTIHDIVLTPDFRQVSYVALSSGGVLGMGSKLYAIPWSAIHVAADGTVTASLDKQALQQVPMFSSSDWPSQASSEGLSTGMAGRSACGQTSGSSMNQPGSSMSGQTSGSSTAGQPAGSTSGSSSSNPSGASTYSQAATPSPSQPGSSAYGQSISAPSNAEVQNCRVSKLTGMAVRNGQGQDIGDIEDFVIDVPDGRVAYTIVSFGGFWGIGQKDAAVPFGAIDLQPSRGYALLNADRQTLESVAFDPSNFPDLSNPQYAQHLHEVFKTEPYGATLGYVSPGQQQAASRNAWSRGSDYNKHFDANQITTIKGTVQSVGTFSPAKGVTEGLRLRVKTTEGKTVTVYAGPASYAQQQNFAFKPGDQITVTGSNSKIGWRSIIMASEIQKDGNTLRLRTKTGEPLWTTAGMQGQPSMGTSSSQSGTTPEPNQPSSSSRSRTRQQSQM